MNCHRLKWMNRWIAPLDVSSWRCRCHCSDRSYVHKRKCRMIWVCKSNVSMNQGRNCVFARFSTFPILRLVLVAQQLLYAIILSQKATDDITMINSVYMYIIVSIYIYIICRYDVFFHWHMLREFFFELSFFREKNRHTTRGQCFEAGLGLVRREKFLQTKCSKELRGRILDPQGRPLDG